MLPIFYYGNLALIPNALGKHQLRPHPFRNQTSKPNTFKAPKANANSSSRFLFVKKKIPSFKFGQVVFSLEVMNQHSYGLIDIVIHKV